MRRWQVLMLECALAGGCGGADDGDDAGTGTATTMQSTGPDAPTGGSGGALVPLVSPMAWQPVPEPDDPLASHRPAEVACPLGGWLYEPQGLEVNTSQCNYAMFTQPSQAAIVPGARFVASLYHFDLIAAEPASAHVAILVGDALVWEQDIAIPGKANAYALDLTLDFTAPAGTPVYFHLHNHGQNTWTLGTIEVASP
jgi:hypothetical protein